MSDHTSPVEFEALPIWAEQLIDNLDEEYGIRTGDRAATNFPDGQAPRWLRGRNRSETDPVPDWIDGFLLDADPTLRQLWLDKGFLRTDPEWIAQLERADEADSARVFVLSGNVNDYAFSPDVGYRPVIDRLQESAIQRKDWVLRYSLSSGFARPVRGASVPDDDPTPFEALDENPRGRNGAASTSSPQEAVDRDLRVMETILRESYNGGVTIILENFNFLAPPDSASVNQNVITDAVSRWAQAPWMFQSDNQVVLTLSSKDDLPAELRSGPSHVTSLTVPRPEGRDSRLKFLAALFAGGRVPSMRVRLDTATRPRFDDAFGDQISEQLQTLADRTSGLNLVGVENLLLEHIVHDDSKLSLSFIKEMKRDLIEQESGGLLKVSEPANEASRAEAFDHVGGLESIREKLVEISELMDRASSAPAIRQSLPSGLLFLGPPGTGKTLVAQAFADACGVNFAELGNIRSMYVGESERNLSQALRLIKSLKPVVVFIDEIDQAMGQRRGGADSGVDQRLFARILQFMSDPDLDGEVVWIGASNEPSQIDPALKRAGRFDMTIPFLRPDKTARKDILQVNFEDRSASIDLSSNAWNRVLGKTEGYTGAELERVAKEAIWTELLDNTSPENVTVDEKSLDRALSAYEPPANRASFQRMEDDALVEVTAVDMLTPTQQSRRKQLLEGDN